MGAEWRATPLFGGAISCEMPHRFVDISDFRPVPDHQEVWADGDTDQSIIVEINEHRGDVPDGEAMRFFFSDLAEANGATAAAVQSDGQVGRGELGAGVSERASFVGTLHGRQTAAKGRQEGAGRENAVAVALAAVRLPCVGSDLLVTVNAPARIAGGSASAEHAGAGDKAGADQAAQDILGRVLRSLSVHDWGLFG